MHGPLYVKLQYAPRTMWTPVSQCSGCFQIIVLVGSIHSSGTEQLLADPGPWRGGVQKYGAKEVRVSGKKNSGCDG